MSFLECLGVDGCKEKVGFISISFVRFGFALQQCFDANHGVHLYVNDFGNWKLQLLRLLKMMTEFLFLEECLKRE